MLRKPKLFPGTVSLAILCCMTSAVRSQNSTAPATNGEPVLRMQVPPSPKSSPAANPADQQILTYDVPLEMVGVVGARLRVLYGNDARVNITTEPGTNKLMVMAPAAVHRDLDNRVRLLLKEIQLTSSTPNKRPETQGPSPLQRQYKLTGVTWRELEDALHRLSGPRMTVVTSNNGELAQFRLAGPGGMQDVLQVDRRADVVTLQGPSTNVYAWLQVVGAIDQGKGVRDDGPQIINVAPADPKKIERALTLVRTVALQQAEEEETLGATTVPGANGGDNGRTAAVGSLDSIDSESGLFGDVQIEFVPELGLVIVRGGKRDVQRVLEVIEQIKKQSVETQPEVEVLLLKHVDSQALEVITKELYEQVLAPRQGAISIKALGQPNALLLVGRRESVASVIELVKKLDQPLDESSQLKVYKLLHSSAVDADRLIRDFFVERPGSETTPRVGLGSRVRVIADYRTNALVIQAAPRDHLEVARLIAEIDVEETPAQNEIRVFPLKYALSTELQPILQSAITGQVLQNQGGQGQGQGQGGGGGGGNQQNATGNNRATPPSSNLSIISKSGDGKLDSGILAGVVVNSNPSINSLIVRAPSRSMELIQALIEQLDRPPSAEAQLKVFEIKNGDATSLALLVQQLFGLPATAGTTTTGGLFGTVQPGGAAANATGVSGLVQLRVSVDTRTNSIIASGSAVDLEVVEVLLLRLDERGIETRSTEVIWLRNSNAAAVAQAINNLLQIQRTNIQQLLLTGQAISIFEQIDREVIVVAEPNTNSLIVSATPRYFQRIRDIIERLDRRPPMIMVQILLAEVTLGDTFEWGSELGLQDSLLFDRNSATGGTLTSPGFNQGTVLTRAETRGQPENLAGQSLSGFGLGRSNSTVGYGGLVLSAASESVNILIRALQDANRIQILSRPQVMTLDTVAAFVQVGSQVPRITAVTGGSTVAGQTVATQDIPVGLIMRVQPRTNQDGLILLDVQVERSNVGDPNSGIPVGFSATGDVIRSPIINTTRAETRVSAYDGQTVVFAGLISKQRTSRSRRIPFLADIPLLGALFRYDTETDTRTELLVVMTPRIVRDPEDVEMINQIESSRMSWCLADVLNLHGAGNLSEGNGLWGPACSPVIYPDLQPTIDSIEGIPTLGGAMGATCIDQMNGIDQSLLLAPPTESPIPQILDEYSPGTDALQMPQVQPSVPMLQSTPANPTSTQPNVSLWSPGTNTNGSPSPSSSAGTPVVSPAPQPTQTSLNRSNSVGQSNSFVGNNTTPTMIPNNFARQPQPSNSGSGIDLGVSQASATSQPKPVSLPSTTR